MENPTRALVIVDVQPTFTEGGALGVDGGNAVAERIADFVTEHADEYELIVTTQDWHVDPGEHFSDNPDFVDTWPPHGVAGTAEAELHEAIASLPIDVSVKKGEYKAAYSGFEGLDKEGTSLEQILRGADIQAVDVVGIAESHCVKETALDSLRLGWPTRVFSDLTVPVSAELGAQARAVMDEAGVEQVKSGEAFGFYEEDESELPWSDEYEDDGFGGSAIRSGVAAAAGASAFVGGRLDAPFGRDEYDADDDDLNGDGVPDDLEGDEWGAADYDPSEMRGSAIGYDAFDEDRYEDDDDTELTSDGEDEELSNIALGADAEDLSGYDLDDFDLDDLGIDEYIDFSGEADDDDFDFSDLR
ncbi:nicotinamidase/pyrazinamidase [Arcanobacterium wilhelmae]|uniref:nicotinamidase n=1 Tax=Arcanobacterium wilhelmae TaxID=1803177 RepID=A0ABT9NBW7_9ACTO|nr:isochorismatase family protein [Arcanobacterium wilhelmae]MDP9801203.1 nicotinamidase/pyrazinamidase [Arcanobacterium wilhelmae]WFN90554.1 isochorismatase family protein [Arcanobacterium wilhelmae]